MATQYEIANLLPRTKVQQHFDKHVDLYVDKQLECYRQASLERLTLLQQVLDCDWSLPLSMLDIGCGGGVLMDLFLDAFPKASVLGVDLSEGMLNENSPSSRKRLLQADALQLPPDIGEFDVINIDTVMHHLICRSGYAATVEQIGLFLKSLHRHLTPGGVVMVREIYHETLGIETLGSRLIFEVSTLPLPDVAARVVQRMGIQTANAGVCFLSRRQWRACFAASGLEVAGVREFPWPGQPYKRLGFKESGDVHYVLARQRPSIY